MIHWLVTGDGWGAGKDVLIVSPTLFFILFSYLFTLSFPPKSQSKSNDLDHKCLSQEARLGVWSEPVLAVPLSLPVTSCGTSLPPSAHTKATKASVLAVKHLPGPQESLSAPTESMEVEVVKHLKGHLSCCCSVPNQALFGGCYQNTKHFLLKTTLAGL